MIQDSVIGIVALTIAAGMIVIALPNRYGESHPARGKPRLCHRPGPRSF